MTQYPRFKAAAAHVAPVHSDIEKSVSKACDVIAEASRAGIRLLAFSECFIPGFPYWGRLVRPLDSDPYFCHMAARAVLVNGPEIGRIRESAKRHDMFVSMGFVEGTRASVGCLWNSNVLIGPDGSILNHHRKLVPTYVEKLVFTYGDGAGLRAVETEIGTLGMLICGENTNLLAKFALMAQGEQVHISSYPAIAPARNEPGTGGYNLQDGIRIRAASYAFEAKGFNIIAAAPWDKTARDAISSMGEESLALLDKGSQAQSLIVDPTGNVISEVLDSNEGLCVADIDLSVSVAHKRMHDIVGYYNRFDVFNFTVDRRRNRPVAFLDGSPSDVSDGPQDEDAAVRPISMMGNPNRM